MKHYFKAAVFVAIMSIPLSSYGDYIRKPTQLMDKPQREGTAIRDLEPGLAVDVVDHQGLWLSVRIEGVSGWVRRLHVGEEPPRDSVQAGGSMAGLVTGRQGSGNVVTTSAARGLDAEQLRTASFNGKELQKMLSLMVSNSEAKKFAEGMED